MKLGIISDVHANLEALDAVLKRFEVEKVDQIVCLGDVVGYGADPNACIERVRSVAAITVLGNHDAALTGHTPVAYFNSYARTGVEWTSRVITDENLQFLKGLPLSHIDDHMLFVHSTPKDPSAWNYIHEFSEAEPQFSYMSEGMTAFIGHSHVPTRFDHPSRKKSIINVGSVGQPRDRDPRACCGCYDSVTNSFEWLRETYDVQEAARKIRAAGLPEYLAVRLFIGM